MESLMLYVVEDLKLRLCETDTEAFNSLVKEDNELDYKSSTNRTIRSNLYVLSVSLVTLNLIVLFRSASNSINW
jgi:hypothetical protein